MALSALKTKFPKKLKIILGVSAVLVLLFSGLFNRPYELRNAYLLEEANERDFQKGLELLEKIQNAYGGKDRWAAMQKVGFVQEADWYGRRFVSGWDTLPQKFALDAKPLSDDASLTLLNGSRQGSSWKLEKGELKSLSDNSGDSGEIERKIVYKNYWFQFPFRISEAEIICYAGQETIGGQTYELLFATWGSEKANTKFDQFMLYIHPETYLIEHLHFTVREVMPFAHLTANFEDFEKIEGFSLPRLQKVKYGHPKDARIRLHENRYLQFIIKP